MSQISQYRSKRPVTASPNHGRKGMNLGRSEQIKRFRSEFPNLPGFSRHAMLRPQSPKVRSSCTLCLNEYEKYIKKDDEDTIYLH